MNPSPMLPNPKADLPPERQGRVAAAPGTSRKAAPAHPFTPAKARPEVARSAWRLRGAPVLLACLSLGLATAAARAVPFLDFHSGPRDLEVPDASLEGVFDSLSVVTPLRQVYDLRVSFNLDPGPDGAFAGDLYMTLVHADRVAVLLNRPGKDSTHPLGYFDSGGFTVTLSDSAPNGDIHRYHDALAPGALASASTPLDGVWQPDGRLVDPRVVSDTSPRTALLSQFLGTDPNGSWTLFLSDLSGGGEVRLRDWSLHFGNVSVPDTDAPLGLLILAGAVMELARRRTIRPT